MSNNESFYISSKKEPLEKNHKQGPLTYSSYNANLWDKVTGKLSDFMYNYFYQEVKQIANDSNIILEVSPRMLKDDKCVSILKEFNLAV